MPVTKLYHSRRYSKAAIYFDFKWRFLTYDAVGLPGEDRPLVRIMGGMGRPWYVLLTAQDIDATLGLLLDMVRHSCSLLVRTI